MAVSKISAAVRPVSPVSFYSEYHSEPNPHPIIDTVKQYLIIHIYHIRHLCLQHCTGRRAAQVPHTSRGRPGAAESQRQADKWIFVVCVDSEV